MSRYLNQGAAGEVRRLVAVAFDLPRRTEFKVASHYLIGAATPPQRRGKNGHHSNSNLPLREGESRRRRRGGRSAALSNWATRLSAVPPRLKQFPTKFLYAEKSLAENPSKFAILSSPFAFPQTRFARLHPQSPVPNYMHPLSCSCSKAQVGRGMSGMLGQPDTARSAILRQMRRAGARNRRNVRVVYQR